MATGSDLEPAPGSVMKPPDSAVLAPPGLTCPDPPVLDPLPPAADPLALGATPVPGGVDLALWAPEATAVILCLFDEAGQIEQARAPLQHQRDGIWHGHLPAAQGGRVGQVYGYRVDGPWAPAQGLRFNPRRVLLDPYATEVVGSYRAATAAGRDAWLGHDPADPGRPHPQDNAAVAIKARVAAPVPPLQAVPRPLADGRQRVIAEVHVRSATARHPDVPAALRGSYAGLAHPALIAHWRRLGVTTLQFLPLQWRADEARLQGLGLSNHWGYNTLGFFAAEPRYGSGQGGLPPDQELREALAALKAAGFELLLDVVYNHSAETDEFGPTLSFRGLGNRQWYRLPPGSPGGYENWSGCGNVLNLAEPMVLRWVMDSLRHWVQVYGFDGFRFDLASALARDETGRFSPAAAFFGALQADPVLRRAVLVAEPWDLGPEGYRPGAYPPGWLAWNDAARDGLRAAWLHPHDARGRRAELAQRLAGSSERFHHDPQRPRAVQASVNFLTAHDGFTLRDLVSYSQRHNLANGEDNRDGHHDNLSWNAGAEGPSDDPVVQAARGRLQRGLLACLLLARGTPMLLMGDELGHSQQGNNNAYCQDNALTQPDWAAADPALVAAIARLIAWRRQDAASHGADWWTGEPAQGPNSDGLPDVAWLSPEGEPLDAAAWQAPAAQGLQLRLAPPAAAHQTVWCLNPGDTPRRFAWPAPQRGARWRCVIDTHQPDAGPAPDADDAAVADPASAPGVSLWLPARCVHVWTTLAAPRPAPPDP